jgi:glycosyltransferase involved in cell wall biosynthesis
VHPTPGFTANKALRIGWEQLGLPRSIRAERLDLFHGPAFALPPRLHVPGVVTIHDLAFLRWPEQVPKSRALHLTRAVHAAAQNAARLIAVSEATKRDVVELLEVDAGRVDVTPLGVDSAFHRPAGEAIAEFRLANELTRPFILTVGNREPRKNLPTMVRAFAKVKDEIPHDLIHAGGAGWKSDELDQAIATANLGGRLRYVDFVPHAELPLWYAAADCFAMPSLYEGFGLPLLEAMACGAPSIATNRSSLPEVAGGAAYLCEPDIDSLASALVTVLHDGELRQELHEAGPERASQFTWQRTAEATADSYRKALDGR